MNKLLLEKIQRRLNEREFKHTISNGFIRFNINVGDVVGKLAIVIDVLDNAFVTYAILSSKVTTDHQEVVSEYLHRANFGLLFGNFEIDYRDGEVRYKIVTDCEDVNNLTNRMIDRSVILPCLMFEKYGSGIYKLLLGIGEPKELIEEAEKKKK